MQHTTTLLTLLLEINRVDTIWRRSLLELLAPLELTDQQYTLLWLCSDENEQPLAQSTLVERLSVSAAQVSGLVDGLSQQGLIAGERKPNDRRRRYWRTTPRGQAVLATAHAQITNWLTSKPNEWQELSLNLIDQIAGLRKTVEASKRAA